MQLYIIFFFLLFKIFYPENDPVWLKHVAEINTTDIIDVLTVLYSFIRHIHLVLQQRIRRHTTCLSSWVRT